jgi:hypothetical protein
MRLLSPDFEVEHLSFSSSGKAPKYSRHRLFLTQFLTICSIPLIYFLTVFYYFANTNRRKTSFQIILTKLLEDFILGRDSISSKVLSLNSLLRLHKYQVQTSETIALKCEKENIGMILFAEDSNYYGTGLIISALSDLKIVSGVFQYTLGTEAEFAFHLGKGMNLRSGLSHRLFAKLALKKSTFSAWLSSLNFLESFPGISLTEPFQNQLFGLHSGLANFYVSNDENELDYLRRSTSEKANYHLVESLELSLANLKIKSGEPRYFGLFLPPNQLTDPDVAARMDPRLRVNYETLIDLVIEFAENICPNDEELVIFPHPRIYQSNPDLIHDLETDFLVSEDFSEYILLLSKAFIFSSAVYKPLREAGVQVLNYDLYKYSYLNVFPVNDPGFINLTNIEDVPCYIQIPQERTLRTRIFSPTIKEVLKIYQSTYGIDNLSDH